MKLPLDLIKEDLYRHRGLHGFRGLIKGWFKPGFRYTLLWRLLTAQKKSSPIRFFISLIKRRYRVRYGYEISYDAQIGKGFYLSDHVGPVVIGPIKMGKYCNISHNVTIGRAYKDGVVGRPTLGDRVWVGTGSVLVGGITIGSDVFIAPNTLLSVDVPDNSFVVGNPPRIIPRENPTKDYITYIRPTSLR